MLLSRIRVAARAARYSSRRRVSSSSVSANMMMDDDDRLREQQKAKKQTLRATVKAKLKATFSSREEDETKKRRDSKVICEKVLELDAFKNARTMCVYVAHPKLNEVDCSVLIREALDSSSSEFGEERVKVYVPIVDDKNSNVRFLRVRDMEKDLEKRTMGIMEPTELDWRTNEPREDVADLKEALAVGDLRKLLFHRGEWLAADALTKPRARTTKTSERLVKMISEGWFEPVYG